MFGLLLWKEWRENLWKLSFCSVASIAFVAMLFRIRITPDISNCLMISAVQMFAVPVIYALDIFSGEMSNRTIYLLFKLPTPRWMIFFSKYLISITGIFLVFVITSAVMELVSGARESEMFFLLKANLSYCVVSLVLFTWFAAFGCQSRSEAGSLVAIFSVIIGWGIIFGWAWTCKVQWAMAFVPYSFAEIQTTVEFDALKNLISQGPVLIGVIAIACYRYVKLRRYL